MENKKRKVFKKQKKLRRVLLDNRLSTSISTYGKTPSRVIEKCLLWDQLEKEEGLGRYAGRKNINKGLFDSSTDSDISALYSPDGSPKKTNPFGHKGIFDSSDEDVCASKCDDASADLFSPSACSGGTSSTPSFSAPYSYNSPCLAPPATLKDSSYPQDNTSTDLFCDNSPISPCSDLTNLPQFEEGLMNPSSGELVDQQLSFQTSSLSHSTPVSSKRSNHILPPITSAVSKMRKRPLEENAEGGSSWALKSKQVESMMFVNNRRRRKKNKNCLVLDANGKPKLDLMQSVLKFAHSRDDLCASDAQVTQNLFRSTLLSSMISHLQQGAGTETFLGFPPQDASCNDSDDVSLATLLSCNENNERTTSHPAAATTEEQGLPNVLFDESVLTSINAVQQVSSTPMPSTQSRRRSSRRRTIPCLTPIPYTDTDTSSNSTINSSSLTTQSMVKSMNKKVLENCMKRCYVRLERLPQQYREPEGRQDILQHCTMSHVQPFTELFTDISRYEDVSKLGEGLYGEVFRVNRKLSNQHEAALKVVPVNGELIVNGERQKNYKEMIPEVAVSVAMSRLKELDDGAPNQTAGFVQLFGLHCVLGRYPDVLLSAWLDWDELRTSENDNPVMFGDYQQYIVFEYVNGGTDMEHYTFRNAAQGYAVIEQIIYSLAVAECEYEFEHRDLHWGNILIQLTTEKTLMYRCNGKQYSVETQGAQACIIDFTLSRMSDRNVVLYQDLTNDEDLFSGDANVDLQFEVYRQMRDVINDDNWSQFHPKTNVLWLDYLLHKMIKKVKYKFKRSKLHKDSLMKMKKLRQQLDQFTSCTQIALFLRQ